jgi:1-aminocyclopropane-1-carboxylate deaminase
MLTPYLTQLQASLDPTLGLHSRVHRLEILRRLNSALWLKREDELGWVGGGTKRRKYASLLPFIQQYGFQELLLIGGPYSNNVLALSQLLVERGLTPRPVLRGSADSVQVVGNHLLLRLLVRSEQYFWVSREDWPQAEQQAFLWAEELRRQGKKVLVIPEGAALPAAMPGLISLWQDIEQNEQDIGQTFDHILIEAGTGITAAILIALNTWLGKKKQIHVLLLAETALDFSQQLRYWHRCLQDWLRTPLPIPDGYSLYPAPLPFGRTNADTFRTIQEMAQTHGIWLDPIYTAPLFQWLPQVIGHQRLGGNILVIHSGGLSSLLGFTEQLEQAILPAEE